MLSSVTRAESSVKPHVRQSKPVSNQTCYNGQDGKDAQEDGQDGQDGQDGGCLENQDSQDSQEDSKPSPKDIYK